MCRNVTEFRHLINSGSNTQNDLNWVINLRDNIATDKFHPKDSAPPEVYFKKTELSAIRLALKEEPGISKVHANNFDHMILKGDKHQKQTQEQLHFYSQLRSNDSQNISYAKSEKEFTCIPFKDRK